MTDTEQTGEIAAILKLWFEETPPEKWFVKDEAFDTLLREKFEPLVRRALEGQLDHWQSTPDGLMALIILLDQMTRNIFRNTPMAFAGDDKALALTMTGLERGYIDQFESPHYQHFMLMPMMHAEDLEVQEASLPLFEKYSPGAHEYAVKHKVIIERFGHFPHRSAILGRPLTEEEEAFLNEPDSSF